MQDTIRLHLSTNSKLLHTNENTVSPWTTTLTVKKKKKKKISIHLTIQRTWWE